MTTNCRGNAGGIRWMFAAMAVICCMLFSGRAYAEETLLASGSTTMGNRIEYAVYTTNGDSQYKTVKITGTGAIPDFKENWMNCYTEREQCPWYVNSMALYAPYYEVGEGITALGAYSFPSLQMLTLSLPSTLERIPANALHDCNQLRELTVLSRNVVFEEGWLQGSPYLKLIRCYRDSTAHQMAREKGIPFECMDCTHADTRWDVTKQATCTETGYRKQYCNICGQLLKEETTPQAHAWGSWITLRKATVFEAKLRKHTCTLCGKTVQERTGTPLTPVLKLNKTSFTLAPGQYEKLVVKKISRGDYITKVTTSSRRIAYFAHYNNRIYAGNRKGTATLTVKLASGRKQKIKVKVTGTIRTAKITGVGKKRTVSVGESVKLTPKLTPANSTQGVTYSSSDPDVAVISEEGILTARMEGQTVITVKSGSVKVTCRVTVR